MATTPVPVMTNTPPFPALSDRGAGTYNSKAFAFGTHMADVFNDEFLAVAASAFANATEAAAKAAIAYQAALDAAGSNGASFSNSQQAGIARDQAYTARDQAVAAAAMAGTTAAFNEINPVVRGNADPTRKLAFFVGSQVAANSTRLLTIPTQDGQIAVLQDIDHRPDTYFNPVSQAVDAATASYLALSPFPGSTQTITFPNFTTAAAGQANSFRVVMVEGFKLGAANLTWPTINWIKPDGSLTTNIAAAGFVLSSTGNDFIILWKRAGDPIPFGKVIR